MPCSRCFSRVRSRRPSAMAGTSQNQQVLAKKKKNSRVIAAKIAKMSMNMKEKKWTKVVTEIVAPYAPYLPPDQGESEEALLASLHRRMGLSLESYKKQLEVSPIYLPHSSGKHKDGILEPSPQPHCPSNTSSNQDDEARETVSAAILFHLPLTNAPADSSLVPYDKSCHTGGNESGSDGDVSGYVDHQSGNNDDGDDAMDSDDACTPCGPSLPAGLIIFSTRPKIDDASKKYLKARATALSSRYPTFIFCVDTGYGRPRRYLYLPEEFCQHIKPDTPVDLFYRAKNITEGTSVKRQVRTCERTKAKSIRVRFEEWDIFHDRCGFHVDDYIIVTLNPSVPTTIFEFTVCTADEIRRNEK